ncbi:hypothetical protein [Flammeovirga kamogawensis]|uniref:Uncharacterized protein n=1 Tax=Flammeovirga kamogawensis TaxID=373891 RepID=A0ABX8GRA2_9BACT|nr:hypothetical protein [Flammeovirga kamogawensis]MBB6463088.1 hypothetical protein [Flammeovirga kamogawensis]QWG05722.1 hypothetical protein KM029_10035 [Flammeovirga kamogawensis]TRX67551.1 hypothetical protein EO216_05065 [Flammeovirga kamogawensis]
MKKFIIPMLLGMFLFSCNESNDEVEPIDPGYENPADPNIDPDYGNPGDSEDSDVDPGYSNPGN